MSQFYPMNRWPPEVPDLERILTRYSQQMLSMGQLALRMLARVLTIDDSFFAVRTGQAMWSQGVNSYPSLGSVAPAGVNQFFLPLHTDYGTVSLIEREPNSPPLQVNSRGVWSDIPHHDRTVIVIIGDMLERWTGGRWQATQHRVAISRNDSADQDPISQNPISLIFFLAADPGIIISPLPEPIGGGVETEPVGAGEYILQCLTH